MQSGVLRKQFPEGSCSLHSARVARTEQRNHHAADISHQEGCDCTEGHVPGERNPGPVPQVEVEDEAEKHADDCTRLVGAAGENSRREDTELGPAWYGRGRKAGSFDMSP